MEIDKIYEGDCLEIMPTIADKSIDMILCDLPYGTTACKWDAVIDLNLLWLQYKRIIKDNGTIVLFGSQPFTTDLINSNRSDFKYELIWDKQRSSQFGLAKLQPMKYHENILIFFKKRGTYNPQKTFGHENYDKIGYNAGNGAARNDHKYGIKTITSACTDGSRFPRSILTFSQNWRRQDQLHPTQKPVALFEYLIKTYTNEGDTVLDNCAGSGTTAIAALNCNRHYILIEKEPKYVEIARKRIAALPRKLTDF
jgi:site-specific DNA-methyltransferase (adenine-specific)